MRSRFPVLAATLLAGAASFTHPASRGAAAAEPADDPRTATPAPVAQESILQYPPQPTLSQRSAAAKRINAVFAKQIDAAKTDAEQRKLIDDMLAAAETERDPVTKFTLLDNARSLAIMANDMPLAVSVVRKIAAGFAPPEKAVGTSEFIAKGSELWEKDGATAADRLAAVEWYVRAEREGVAGLDKVLVEGRLKEAEATSPEDEDSSKQSPGSRFTYLRSLPRSEVKLLDGWVLLRTPKIAGKRVQHGLSTHPPSRGASHVVFTLDRQYKALRGKVGVDDEAMDLPGSPLTFKILLNGDVAWKSRPIQNRRDFQDFSVPLNGTKKLELVVECPGPHHGCHAMWIDPQLSR